MRRFSIALVLAALAFPPVADGAEFKIVAKKGVTDVQQAEIAQSLDFAEAYFDKRLDGGIPAATARKIRVRLDLSGTGSASEGGGAPAAMSVSNGLPRLYFDLKHSQWGQTPFTGAWTKKLDNQKVVVHEYTHAWSDLLARNKRVPGWMNEGFAEYLAYAAMIDAGLMQKARVDYFVGYGAKDSDEVSKPLIKYEGGKIWPGHVGYLAASWLVAESPNGPRSIRLFYENLGKGQSVKRSFKFAFGVELRDFYKIFELWRPSLQKIDSENGFAKIMNVRPKIR